jgi:hypothetical protein
MGLDNLSISPPATTAFDEAIDPQDLRDCHRRALRLERAMILDWLQRSRGRSDFVGDFGPDDGQYGELKERLYCGRLGGPARAFDVKSFLDCMNERIRLTQLPSYQARPKLDAQIRRINALPWYARVTKNVAPTYEKTWAKVDYTVADLDLCRISLALKAYQYERHAYPATLVELQKTIKWAIPKDPFSGKDYIYRRQGKGFIVYSLGQNMTDENGLPERDAKGNDRREKSDIVWQCTR